MERKDLLRQLSFGSQVAEEEVAKLQEYFVETDTWSRVFHGEIDVVRGEKGAGKSALYLLLNKHEEELFDRGILIVSAENPRGSTVFKDLISDPPTSEPEFVILWKVYILTIVCYRVRDLGIDGGKIAEVYGALEEAGLLERELNLPGLLRSAHAFVRRLLYGAKYEAGVELDQITGMPSGIIGRISLAEPSGELRSRGVTSVDGMFQKVDEALKASGFIMWVLLDRLDVAFAESHDLEANAIRALTRVYSDLRAVDAIQLKIFLREDIWKRVTRGGLREASHVTRFIVMRWTPPMLLNLAMRRILSNPVIEEEFHVDKEEVLKDFGKQEQLFNRLFPPQVEQGPQKASTFNWMLTRCADATDQTAPREVIHLLNCIRDEEIGRLERGGAAAPGEQLFDRSVFKAALPTVSETRLNTYLYAEYPSERSLLERLHGEKAEQTPESLATIWGVGREEALAQANQLAAIGFFQPRGTKAQPTFWVPFLYRDALNLRQGKADSEDEGASEAVSGE
jgi:hypothetical protein